MYTDFEWVLIKQHGCTSYGKKSWTEYLQHLLPSGACFYVESSDESLLRRPVIFRRETAVEEFLDSMVVTAIELRNILKKEISYEATNPTTNGGIYKCRKMLHL